MTTTSDGPIARLEEDSGQPLPLEQVFAQELLADPDSAERWVTKTDQADLPARLLQWAQAVAAGTPRTQAPWWADTASAAFTRWLDARDSDGFDPAMSATSTGDQNGGRKIGATEEDLYQRIDRLESTLGRTIRLLAKTISYVPVTGVEGLQHEAETLARLLIIDG
jgi:hypothetical protein